MKVIFIFIAAFLCITADRCNGSVVKKADDFHEQQDESPKSAIRGRKVAIHFVECQYNIFVCRVKISFRYASFSTLLSSRWFFSF